MENISFVHSAQFGFQTPVYCIISDERVHRSKSPLMYNRVLQQMGLNGAYVPFQGRTRGIWDRPWRASGC